MLRLPESGDHHRCSDRCMYAKGSQCDCACGGENHGKGRGFLIEFEGRPEEQVVQEELFGRAPRGRVD